MQGDILMKKRTIVAITVISIIALTLHAFPQTYAGDWNTVMSQASESRIVIQLHGGEQLKGRFVDASDVVLNLKIDGRIRPVPRGEIFRVYSGRSGSKLKSGLIGAAIGLGIGVGIGVLYEVGSREGDGLAPAAGVFYGLPAGAAVGALVGGGMKKDRLIYQSP